MDARFLPCLMITALVFGAGAARAQDLGSTAAAMGASSALEANPMRGGQQQINRAAAVAGQNTQAAPAPAVPAPAQAAAVSTNAAPAASAAAGAPATAVGAKTAAPAPADTAADLHTPFSQSFFFTAQDIIAIHKAMEQQPVLPNGPGPQAAQVIPPVRRIVLSGVVYKAADDWLIWINGQKVTPWVSMKEIVDIKVERERVHLKWFDIGKNGVIDITMRPNETYDIVTGVLLPGVMK